MPALKVEKYANSYPGRLLAAKISRRYTYACANDEPMTGSYSEIINLNWLHERELDSAIISAGQTHDFQSH